MNIELLFKYYYRPLCLYAIHYLDDMDGVEDIVQDAFVGLWEQLQADKDIENTKAWLYTAVRNRCIDHLRKAHPTEQHVEPHDVEGSIGDDEAQERSLHEAELWTAIDTLPTRCREAFLRSKRDNQKYREIAEAMGISERTVEHQISKALRLLRRKADDFFYLLCSVA